jgi:hypothetical protein
MTDRYRLEHYFLIPLRRDSRLSDGEPHAETAWAWLHDQLWEKFGLVRYSNALEIASWRDKDGVCVHDESRKYTIALFEEETEELTRILTQACEVFWQECIYFHVEGRGASLVYPVT